MKGVGVVGDGLSMNEADALVKGDGGGISRPSPDDGAGCPPLFELMESGEEEKTAVSRPLSLWNNANRFDFAFVIFVDHIRKLKNFPVGISQVLVNYSQSELPYLPFNHQQNDKE